MAKVGELDWGEIRQVYATTDLSFRRLAARFGCSHQTIAKKAKAERWDKDREQVRTKRLTITAEAQGAALARGVEDCVAVAQALLKRIRERVEWADEPILPQEYRQLTGAVKDIRDILTSDLDIQRKQADIEQIRRSLGDGQDKSLRVVIDGGTDYSS